MPRAVKGESNLEAEAVWRRSLKGGNNDYPYDRKKASKAGVCSYSKAVVLGYKTVTTNGGMEK